MERWGISIFIAIGAVSEPDPTFGICIAPQELFVVDSSAAPQNDVREEMDSCFCGNDGGMGLLE